MKHLHVGVILFDKSARMKGSIDFYNLRLVFYGNLTFKISQNLSLLCICTSYRSVVHQRPLNEMGICKVVVRSYPGNKL